MVLSCVDGDIVRLLGMEADDGDWRRVDRASSRLWSWRALKKKSSERVSLTRWDTPDADDHDKSHRDLSFCLTTAIALLPLHTDYWYGTLTYYTVYLATETSWLACILIALLTRTRSCSLAVLSNWACFNSKSRLNWAVNLPPKLTFLADLKLPSKDIAVVYVFPMLCHFTSPGKTRQEASQMGPFTSDKKQT